MIVAFFAGDYRRHDGLYRKKMDTAFEDNYQAAFIAYDYTSKIIYDELVNRPEVLKLMAAALDDSTQRDVYRSELYRLLLPAYEEQKAIGLRQFHFHFRDGTSFLRMHAPDKYGDSLFRDRYSLYIANAEKSRVTGFEAGHFADGFRYINPLFYQGRHIGSVELVITGEGIIEYINQVAPGHYSFLVNRSFVDPVTYPDWQQHNYTPSSLSDMFLTNRAAVPDDLIAIIDRKIRGRVRDRIADMQRFVEKETVDGTDYLIIFLPVRDVKGDLAAYFVQYINDDYSGHHLGLAVIDIILFTLLSAVLFFSIDRLQDSRKSLQRSNIEYEKITETLQQYKLLARYARDIILFIDMDGRVLDCNEAAERAYGYSRNELSSLNIKELRSGRTHHSISEQMKLANQQGFVFETEHRRRDGSVFPVEVSSVGMDIGGRRVLLSVIRDITDRKKTEEAMIKSENLLRTIIDNEPECVKLLARDGSLLMMNSAGLKMIQADSIEQVKGACVYPIVSPEYRDAFRKVTEDVFTGKPGLLAFKAVGLKGNHIWLETHAVPLYNEDDEIFALLGITRDITERKKAEDALRESEERFRSAFNYSAIGMALVAPDGRWLLVNSALCSIVGYSEEELMQRTFQDVTHPDDLDADLGYVRQMLAGEIRTYQMEKRYIHKLGHVVWILLSVSLVRDTQGESIYFISQIQDITTRKKGEEALKESERRYRETLGTLNMLAVQLDIYGGIIFVNEFMLNLSGWEKDDILGKNWMDIFIDPGIRDEVKALHHRNCLSGDIAVYFDNEIVLKNGQRRLISWSNSRLIGMSGDIIGVTSIGIDITERRQAEEKLRRSEHQLSESQRVAKIGSWSWDLISNTLEWSDETCRRFDRDPATFTPTVEYFLGLIHPDDRDAVERTMKEALEKDTPYHIQTRIINQTGREWVMEAFGIVERDENGKALRFAGTAQDISERRLAERAIEKELELRGVLLDNMPCIALIMKRDTREIVACNDIAKRFGAVIGRTCFETLTHAGSPCPFCLAPNLWDTGQKQHAEAEYLGRAWEGIWVPFSDELYVHYIFDITERRESELLLRKSESNLKRAEELGHMGNWDWDIVTNKLVWSDEVFRLYGMDPEKDTPSYETVLDTILPEYRDAFVRSIEKALKDHELFEGEYSIMLPDGSQKNTYTKGEVIYSSTGQPVRMFGMVQDITIQKKAEEELRNSEERYRSLFEGSPDAIFIADPQTGEIVDANPSASHLLKRPIREIIGMHQSHLHPPRILDRAKENFREHVEQTSRGEEPQPIENIVLCSDGTEVPVEIMARIITIKGRKLIQGVFRDITVRKHAEEQIQRSLREKETLLKEIHHRVKNNMQVISSLLSMQIRHVHDDTARRVLSESRNRIKSMALIHEKLYRSEDIAHVDFGEYIRSLLDEIMATYNMHDIDFAVDVSDIFLDVNLAIPCGLMINELVSNSLKHAFPDGGHGVISIAMHREHGSGYVLTVADNGKGFPPDVDFRDTHSLGLQIVNVLTMQIQGEIALSADHGTRFTITFHDHMEGRNDGNK